MEGIKEMIVGLKLQISTRPQKLQDMREKPNYFTIFRYFGFREL